VTLVKGGWEFMVGSVDVTSSEAFGVGFFGVGLVDFGDPVSVAAKSVGFENFDVDNPFAGLRPRIHINPAIAEFGIAREGLIDFHNPKTSRGF
jgi:hypothetical protein